MVPLIETLFGRGYDIRVYDESIKLPDLVGTNKSFLKREIPHISSLILPTVSDVLRHSEVVVLTPAFRGTTPALRHDQCLIDLNGVLQLDKFSGGSYDGICW